jgi:hypothetical protein
VSALELGRPHNTAFYDCDSISGGTGFFTVTLLERRPKLSTEPLDDLRASSVAVRKAGCASLSRPTAQYPNIVVREMIASR